MGYADWLCETGSPDAPYARTVHDALLAFRDRDADQARLCLRAFPPAPALAVTSLSARPRTRHEPLPLAEMEPASYELLAGGHFLWANVRDAARHYRLPLDDTRAAEIACTPWDAADPALLAGQAPRLVWAYLRRLTADACNAGWVTPP